MAKETIDIHYKEFLKEIKEKVYQVQYHAMKQVNKALIQLYWDIGQGIVMKQSQHKWGKSIVETLSVDLQKEFPGISGFSAQNLWYMRKFFHEYYQDEFLQPLVGEIGWSHNIILMDKCKDKLRREFYIKMVIKYGWTKDEYNFEFLEISDNHNERELESAIIKNMRNFLTEMGGDFAFIGNQYRLEVGDDNFYLDILLYHRRLKSLVAIELKPGKFKPEYAGKMNFYLSVLNDRVKMEEENPSIGIIVCKSKDRTQVEYALKELNQPMSVAAYQTTPTLPKDYKKYLPSPQTIIESLSTILAVVK